MFKILFWNYLHIQLWTGAQKFLTILYGSTTVPRLVMVIHVFLVIKKSEEYWKSSTIVLRKLQSKFPKLFLSKKGPGSEGDYFDKEWVREVY